MEENRTYEDGIIEGKKRVNEELLQIARELCEELEAAMDYYGEGPYDSDEATNAIQKLKQKYGR